MDVGGLNCGPHPGMDARCLPWQSEPSAPAGLALRLEMGQGEAGAQPAVVPAEPSLPAPHLRSALSLIPAASRACQGIHRGVTASLPARTQRLLSAVRETHWRLHAQPSFSMSSGLSGLTELEPSSVGLLGQALNGSGADSCPRPGLWVAPGYVTERPPPCSSRTPSQRMSWGTCCLWQPSLMTGAGRSCPVLPIHHLPQAASREQAAQ